MVSFFTKLLARRKEREEEREKDEEEEEEGMFCWREWRIHFPRPAVAALAMVAAALRATAAKGRLGADILPPHPSLITHSGIMALLFLLLLLLLRRWRLLSDCWKLLFRAPGADMADQSVSISDGFMELLLVNISVGAATARPSHWETSVTSGSDLFMWKERKSHAAVLYTNNLKYFIKFKCLLSPFLWFIVASGVVRSVFCPVFLPLKWTQQTVLTAFQQLKILILNILKDQRNWMRHTQGFSW